MNSLKELLFKRGFSETLYFYNFRAVWIFTAACYLLTALSGYLEVTDLSIVSVGVPAAFAELGLHTGFIIWKAKIENCRKNKDVNNLKELEEIEL